MNFRRKGFQQRKSDAMADPVKKLSKKPLIYPKKEMKQKALKMKVGSAASKVRFIGWRLWSKNAKSWTQCLRSAHQSTWKSAGIYDAIMASEYPVRRQDDLILELASRWCSKTNTFIFPWGEATITLEDVMVLGGFSALGVTTLTPPKKDAKWLVIEKRLELARVEIQRGKSSKAVQSKWMTSFMGRESDIEHEAFLMYWLSRFVFPSARSSVINRHIFHIAIQLSRGIKLALARPVLAMLYKDLTALNKRLMDMASVSDTRNNELQLDVFAPFHIIQLWAWERLPLLKPITNSVYSSEELLPRVARWSQVKILKDWDLMSSIDLGEESFVWCPYGAFDEESFAQCIKPSKLEGFDCVEKYIPQRVARQFGLIQDIPSDHGDELTKQVNFKDYKFCVKSRLAKPTATTRYQKWWKEQRSPLNSSQVKLEKGIKIGPPPGFPPRIDFITISDSDSDDEFGDEEDTLPSAYTSAHVPLSQIGSESPFSSSISDNEFAEIDDFSFESPEEVVEESGKPNDQIASSSKTAQVKGDYEEKVIAIDDSSEDEDETQEPRAQPELPKRGCSRVAEAGKGLNILKEDACKKVTCSNQDSRDGTEGTRETPGSNEIVRTALHNGLGTNFDAESFTDDRTQDSGLNLEARISKLENIVFAITQVKDQK